MDYRYLEVNRAFERLSGLAAAPGKTMLELSPDTEAYWIENYARVARTGEPLRQENFHEASGRWYTAYASRVGGEDSRQVAIVFDDITERKRYERRQAFLLELSDALRPLSDSAEIQGTAARLLRGQLDVGWCYYTEFDATGTVATVLRDATREGLPSNAGAHDLSDAPEFTKALRTGRVFNVPDFAAFPLFNPRIVERYTSIGMHSVLGAPLVKDGRLLAVLLVADTAPREWPEDAVTLLVDVAERTWAAVERARAESALRASEERFRTLSDASPALIWQNNARGENFFINQHFLDFAGMSAEEMRGAGWHSIVHPEDREAYVADYLAAVRARRGWNTQSRIRRHDGEWRWFDNHAQPLFDAGGEYLGHVGASVDITERKRAEEAIRAALQEAEQARGEAEAAGAAKDHFLAVLSHELRTPLMPITMALAILGRHQNIPEAVRDVHEMIKRNVELEARFIDDLLDVTRIARGKMEIVRADMDLHEAVRRAVEIATPDIEAKGQRLTVALETPECPLSGDFVRLQQVFWNLLKNASKFTPEGGAITIRSACPPGQVHFVEITDTGIGLEAEAIERIFRPFEQANVAITREFGGLGLGLAIAKATVEAHGGELRAASPGPGQGATFTVSLPLL